MSKVAVGNRQLGLEDVLTVALGATVVLDEAALVEVSIMYECIVSRLHNIFAKGLYDSAHWHALCMQSMNRTYDVTDRK